MPISELCSSFYLFKPLEKCVLLDTRGMGYESVAWYESISITGRKQQKSHFATRVSVVWFLPGEDGSPSYTSVGSTAQPLSSPTGYFPLLIELSSLGAQFISGCWGELSMRGNSPQWSVTPFSTNVNWVTFLLFPNHPSVLSYATFEFQKGRRQLFFSSYIWPEKTTYETHSVLYCSLANRSERFTSLKKHIKYKPVKFSMLFSLPITKSCFFEGSQ